MTERVPRNAYWFHDVLRVSEPIVIDGHRWRLVQYRKMGSGRRAEPRVYVDYDWQKPTDLLQRWHQACDWPGALPPGLRALHDACPWARPPHEDQENST